MKLKDITQQLLPIIDFKFITADRFSVKLWTLKPTYDHRSKCWTGDTCVCMLDLIGKVNLEEFRATKMIAYSRAIEEVK